MYALLESITFFFLSTIVLSTPRKHSDRDSSFQSWSDLVYAYLSTVSATYLFCDARDTCTFEHTCSYKCHSVLGNFLLRIVTKVPPFVKSEVWEDLRDTCSEKADTTVMQQMSMTVVHDPAGREPLTKNSTAPPVPKKRTPSGLHLHTNNTTAWTEPWIYFAYATSSGCPSRRWDLSEQVAQCTSSKNSFSQ